MKLAKPQNKAQVIAILTAAFNDNKSVNYILPQDGRRLTRMKHLMDYSFELCMLFGKVYLSNDNKACALVLFPELKKINLNSVILDLKLIIRAIGVKNVGKTISRERKMKAIQPKDRMAYLWFVGVDPLHQHQGIGKKLLQELIDHSASAHRPIYLETSTLANLPWYQQLGFEVYHQLSLDYELFFLKRPLPSH